MKWSREKSGSPFGNDYFSDNKKFRIKNNSVYTRKMAFELYDNNTNAPIKAFNKIKDAKAYAETLEG
jgi:hypothetical protein